MSRGERLNYMVVLLLPIAYVITYWTVGNQRGPYYWTPNQDPDYAYLVNSLVLALFKVPQHTDHPGTPLQILGAIVLWSSYAVQALFDPTVKQTLAEQVLSTPEFYLTLFNATLIALTAGSILALGWVALRLSKNLLLVLILQISPLLLITTFLAYEPSRVAPDVLLVCISQVLALILVRYLYLDWARSPYFSVELGAVFGLGMATKATFLPAVLYFLLPQGWRNKALAIGAALVAFVLATLPILPRYGRTFGWMTNIATRTGSYGRGETGLVDVSNLAKYVNLLFSRNLVFFAVLLIVTVACFSFALCWRYWGETLKLTGQHPDSRKVYFLLVLTTLVGWGQVLLTLRQQPWSRYLNPTAALMGFLIFLLVQLCLVILSKTSGNRVSGWVVPAVVLALCVAVSIQQANASGSTVAAASQKRLKELTAIETILQRDEYQSCVLIRSRRASTLESALNYGDFWAGNKLSAQLTALYPELVFYTDKDREFETFEDKPVTLAALAKQGKGCVLLASFAMPAHTWKANQRPVQPIDAVFEGKFEALYRIKTN